MSRLRRNRSHGSGDGAPRPDMRMRVYSVGVLFGLTVLGGRLVQLQGADANALAGDHQNPATAPAVVEVRAPPKSPRSTGHRSSTTEKR